MSEYKDYNWQNEQFTCAHSYLLPEIEKQLSGKETILDLGCGNGVLANYLIEKGYNVYGTDASQTGITIANRKNSARFCIQNLATSLLPDFVYKIWQQVCCQKNYLLFGLIQLFLRK